MSPSESKWTQVNPIESKWVQVIQRNPNKLKWIHVHSLNHVNSSESKWIQVNATPPPESSYPNLGGLMGWCPAGFLARHLYQIILPCFGIGVPTQCSLHQDHVWNDTESETWNDFYGRCGVDFLICVFRSEFNWKMSCGASPIRTSVLCSPAVCSQAKNTFKN